jgi:hypothetical protein
VQYGGALMRYFGLARELAATAGPLLGIQRATKTRTFYLLGVSPSARGFGGHRRQFLGIGYPRQLNGLRLVTDYWLKMEKKSVIQGAEIEGL